MNQRDVDVVELELEHTKARLDIQEKEGMRAREELRVKEYQNTRLREALSRLCKRMIAEDPSKLNSLLIDPSDLIRQTAKELYRIDR